MKYIFSLIIGLAIGLNAQAQYLQAVNSNIKSIQLKISNSNVKVIGTDVDSIKIESVDSKGKLMESKITDLNVSTKGGTIVVEKTGDAEKSYVFYIPKQLSFHYQEELRGSKLLEIRGLTDSIFVKTWLSKIALKYNTGVVDAVSEAADIEVVYGENLQLKPASFISKGRLIRISLPEKAKAVFTAEVVKDRFKPFFKVTTPYHIISDDAKQVRFEDIKLNGGGSKIFISGDTILINKSEK